MKIDVLDHGFVRMVDHMGDDTAISRAARVSYDAPPRPQDGKLINYLMKNRHTSPFEAVSFTFEVKAPMFVLRQWHRHRTWSYNELSARYKELPTEFYVPELEQITTQSEDNKQMRTEQVHEFAEQIQLTMELNNEAAHYEYRKLIEAGCPRELARSILPLATYSHMFASVDLHNLFHFIRLRIHEHAQYEIRVYAEALLELIGPIVPIATKAFEETL